MIFFVLKRIFAGLLISSLWLFFPILSALFPDWGLSERFINLLIWGFLITFIFKIYSISNNYKKHYSTHLFDQIVNKISFDFEKFKNKPTHLINWNISLHQSGHWRNFYVCIRCLKNINKKEFHWSNLGTNRPQKICFSCLKFDGLGRFDEEIKYADLYHTEFEFFCNKFNSLNLKLDKSLIYKENEIKDFFDRSIINVRRKN